ncbi:MAG: group II intron reverse transcriptase/maturase, partial [Synergistaceae bacterium]|nr:group II intron reverse transcriptase/maturase [Synergistaceae bacterium]
MLEAILSPDNLNTAYAKVARNKGTYGIDGMTTEQLLPFLEAHGESLRQSLLDGTYIPQPVRAVKIPKGNGKFRTLGIPTAIDRFIQRAIVQVLMPLYEAVFSENSYGFRPERGVEDAVKKCLQYFNSGYDWAVDMDLEKFFDSVCREKLLRLLFRDIHDERVLYLLGAYINSGIVDNGRPVHSSAGIHQGGPLSPLLANIMLNELDKELLMRRENFVRYADDMMIFCRNRASAYQALKH